MPPQLPGEAALAPWPFPGPGGTPVAFYLPVSAGPARRARRVPGPLLMPNATVRPCRPATLPAPRPARLPAKSFAVAPGARRWLTLAVVVTAAFLGTLDFFILNVALPAIQ